MKRIVHIAVLLSMFCPIYGRAGEVFDGLRGSIASVEDERKIELLVELADSLSFIDPGTAIKYYETATELAKIIKNDQKLADCLVSHGDFNFDHGDYKFCVRAYSDALRIYQSIPDSSGMANAHLGLGLAYSDLSMYSAAMEHYISSKNIYEETNDTIGLAYLYLNLGATYSELDDLVQAKTYSEKAFEYFQKLGRVEEQADILQNMGNYYSELGNEEMAYEQYAKALNIYRENDFIAGLTLCLANAGSSKAELGSLSNGIEMLEESVVLARRSKDLSTLTYALATLGNLQYRNKNYNAAKLSLEEAKELAFENDFLVELQSIYEYIGELKHCTGDQLGAYVSQIQASELRDSLEHANKLSEVNSQMLTYETQKRDQQIKRLEAEQERNVLEQSKNSTLLWLIGGIILIILLVVVILLTSIQKHRKRALILEEHNQELKRITESLSFEREQAQKAIESKSEFLSMMTHELRTPLNAVIGIAGMLEREQKDKRNEEALGTLKFASNNLLNLINDILDFNKLEHGSVSMENVEFDLTKLLQNIRMSFQHEAANRNIAFSMHRNQNVPTRVIGDPTRLGQVLTNLVSNALKFTPQGFVRVYTELVRESGTEARVRFIVKDTGIGIPKDKQDLIFNSYQQADDSTSRKFGGTGLGLSICKKIIENFGGELKLESEPGTGSTFVFEIPFRIAEGQDDVESLEIKPQMLESMKAQIRFMKVLVVDDNELNLFVAKNVLQSLDIDVIEATNGKLALEKLESGIKVDAVLLDLQMPMMDGFETAAEIRKLNSDIPVIALTASRKDELTMKQRQTVFEGFIKKPFDPEEIIENLYNSTKSVYNSAS